MTYEASDIEYLRLLISDVGSDPVFRTAELELLLSRHSSVELAAATALEIIAANEVMTAKAISSNGLKTDGPAVAAAMLAAATRLRENAGADVVVTEFVPAPVPLIELGPRGLPWLAAITFEDRIEGLL